MECYLKGNEVLIAECEACECVDECFVDPNKDERMRSGVIRYMVYAFAFILSILFGLFGCSYSMPIIKYSPGERWMIFDTSLGITPNAENCWPYLLQKEIPEVQILNSSVGGVNSFYGIDHISDVFKMEVKKVFIDYWVNDAFAGPNKYYKNTVSTLETSRKNYETLIDTFQHAGIEVILISENFPVDTFILGRNPAKDRPEWVKFRNQIKDIAKERNCPLIDITSTWEKMSKVELMGYFRDGLHPSAEANKEVTVPEIEEALH